MSRSSHHNMESFSRFVIAVVGAIVLLGGATWAFVALDNHGCSGGITCHAAGETSQPHY